MIKAVFIDIDGTLLNSKREISINVKNQIKRCINKNVKIILVSGRSRLDTSNIQKEVQASPFIISSNGAEIYDIENEKVIYSSNVDKETLRNLLEYSVKKELKISFNYDDKLIMNRIIFEDEKNKVRSIEEIEDVIYSKDVVQCAISDTDFEKMKKAREYLKETFKKIKIANESKRFEDENYRPSKNYFCDITSKITTKGNAVKKMIEFWGFNTDEIAVIGDGKNDISMFKLTPNSIAMENSIDDLKSIASFVTGSNDEDGVAKALNKIIK